MAKVKFFVFSVCFIVSATGYGQAADDFMDAKTVFQTNTGYDQRLGIAADAVIVHRHGAGFERQLKSWQEKGFLTGRMFFADSDATNIYWTGKWDGIEHTEDVERNQNGEVVKCANVRPYMLPTDGWIRHLEEMTEKSIAAGAGAILPEEPLAHVFTGYEKSFRQLWEKRYGIPWRGQHEDAEARFLTAQLKNELYIELETRLLAKTKEKNPGAAFVVPIHSIYSNIAAQLVAPLGTSTQIDGVDGYIGQIWTGPVNWALGHYDSPTKSFFGSAYVLYDYFTQLTVASDKKLWLLVDPVEDNPNHTWDEFTEWYKHCIAAMLLMDEVDSYEIMPWPDRIFLPGYQTGGKTPAPEDYRTTILAVTQVLQEIPKNTEPQYKDGYGSIYGYQSSHLMIGVAVSDTLMWQKHDGPWLQGMYGMLLPLVEMGVPVSSCILERVNDEEYMKRFKFIILSYEDFKPVDESINTGLAQWSKGGGRLIVIGKDGDELDNCTNTWWQKQGYKSPLQHLMAQFGKLKEVSEKESTESSDKRKEYGRLYHNDISPREIGRSDIMRRKYKQLIGETISPNARALLPIRGPGYFCIKRGDFVIVHTETSPFKLHGTYIDIFDPDLAIVTDITLKPGLSGLYRNVESQLKRNVPFVLHATHRLMGQEYQDGKLEFVIRGPGQTPAVARVFKGRIDEPKVTAVDVKGKAVEVEVKVDGQTLLVRFGNVPEGVTVTVQ